MTVFANALEVSSKAQGCKIIAAFPDVCFTPPQTPATPPGVPVPYPNFGMDSDLASGSGTVKIGGKPISQENSSNYSRISGDEAGCAPKKGVVTSKNMGKAYAQMWSMDVKADGKGVVRFGDIATSNHASNTGDTPPFPVVGTPNPALMDCVSLLNELGMQVHQHSKSPCQHPDQSEHPLENQMMQKSRGGVNYAAFPKYKTGDAPCICMRSYNYEADGVTPKTGPGSMKGAPHPMKSTANRDLIKKNPNPTVREALDETKQAYGDHHDKLQPPTSKEKKEEALECIELIVVSYLQTVAQERTNSDGSTRQPTTDEVLATKLRT
jgi:hypothetical protein